MVEGLDKKTVARVLFAAAALVGIWLLGQLIVTLSSLWILVFGSVVVAVVLRSIADPLVRYTPLNDTIGTLVALLLIVLAIAGLSYFFGYQLAQEAAGLSARVPQGWEQLQAQILALPYGAQVLEQLSSAGGQAARAFSIAPRLAMGFASGLATLLLVIVAGVFLATDPGGARDGVLTMLPHGARARGREVLNACGFALKGWLRAQALSMVLVGGLATIGLYILGVPSALALGVLSGLAQFVPIVGPFVATVPAVLVGATAGWQTAWLTLALYVAISQLEANLITPLVQRNVASLPVVLGVFAVVGIGSLFGAVGVLFATPLALTLYTVVTMLYRQDVLDDEEAEAPGQQAMEKDEAKTEAEQAGPAAAS